MSKSAPIVVYLDSSDYSTLSDPARLATDPSLADVLAALLQLRDRSVCEFRYSFVHVMEMLPLDENSFTRAEARLGLMQDLCGRKCIRPYDEIDREELKNALNQSVLNIGSKVREYAFSDNARWTPQVSDLLERIAAACLQTAANIRAAAKRNQNHDLSKINYLIGRYLNDIQLARCDEQIPISQATKNKIIAMVHRNSKVSVIVDELWEGFCDLRATAKWALQTELGRQFTALLRSKTKISIDSIQQVRNSAAEFIKTSANEGDGRRKAAGLLKENVDVIRSMYLPDHIKETVELHSAWFATHKISIASLEAIDLSKLSLPRVEGLLANYPENLLVNYTSDRKLEKAISDYGDIQHACYIPYVDIFRADSFAAQIFKAHAATVQTFISTSIQSLPNEIVALANQRETNNS